MKLKKLLVYALIAFCFVSAKDVYADTASNCKLLDESKAKDQILSVGVHDGSYTEYKIGDKFYVNVYSGLTIKKTDEIAVILKPTINTDGRVLTAYIKNINTRNEDGGQAYFIIPQDAVVGEEYEIWGYNFARETTEVMEYVELPDGTKQPIYYQDCAMYVTHEEDQKKDNWNRLYIYNSNYKIKIVEDYREVKNALKTVTIDEKTAYFGGTYHFNVTTTEPVSRIVLGFNNDVFIDGHNSGSFESYMFYASNATSYSAEVDVPTYGVNYVYPGTYYLKTVMLYYPDGTYTRYSTNKAYADSERETQYFESNLSLTLEQPMSNIVGEGAFEVKGLTLESNTAPVGERVEIRTNFAYDTASKEVTSVLLTFNDDTNRTMFSTYLKSLIHDSYIVIPSVAKEGTYKLKSVVITVQEYKSGKIDQVIVSDEGGLYNEILSQTLTVTKSAESDQGTNILYFTVDNLDEDVYKIINEAKDSSIITVNAGNSGVIPANLFDLIKESTKQLIIESNGNEWVFNGTDIEESKPLNVSMKLGELEDIDISDSIKKAFGKDAMAIMFPNNGKLPGKALIRIKDETLYNKMPNDKFYVYYVDSDGNKINRVATEVQKSYNGYVEFYIDHNSTYIISSKEITDSDVLGKDDEIMKVNSPSAKEVSGNKDSNTVLYIIIGVCAAVVVAIVVFLMSNKNKAKKNDEVKKEEPKETKEETEEKKEE